MSLFAQILGPTVSGLLGRGAVRQPGKAARPAPPAQSRYESREATMRTMGLPQTPFPITVRTAKPTASPERQTRRPRKAATYSEDTLNLGTNSGYRGAIVGAARRTKLPPQLLAAVIDTEARDTEDGVWDPASRNGHAVGLAQFGRDTWIEEAQRPGTYLNATARHLGYIDQENRLVAERQEDLLALRTDPAASINATADYAANNLAFLRDQGLIGDDSPEAQARFAYMAHHEGRRGARDLLRGTRRVTEGLYRSNVPAAQQSFYLDQNEGDYSSAYRAFMLDHVGREIDMRRYTNSAD